MVIRALNLSYILNFHTKVTIKNRVKREIKKKCLRNSACHARLTWWASWTTEPHLTRYIIADWPYESSMFSFREVIDTSQGPTSLSFSVVYTSHRHSLIEHVFACWWSKRTLFGVAERESENEKAKYKEIDCVKLRKKPKYSNNKFFLLKLYLISCL